MAGTMGGPALPKRGFGVRSRPCKLRPIQAFLLAFLGLAVIQMYTRVRSPLETLLPRTIGNDEVATKDGAEASADNASRQIVSRAHSTPSIRKELLLASHGRLMWFDVDSGDVRVVHEGRGAYYGVVPASVTAEQQGQSRPRVWVVSRPHNWRPKTTREALLLIDTEDGTLLEELPTATSFTHDAVRHGDKMFLADTGAGAIGRVDLASRATTSSVLFTFTDHVNTVAVVPTSSGKPMLWAVLHGLGQSSLVAVDPDTMQIVQRFKRVGVKSHGFSLWRGKVVMLSSEEGTVILVDLAKAEAEGDAYQPEKLWVEPSQTFMKGLTVIENIAYFGISSFGTRSQRDSPSKSSEVAAFDLMARKLLWRRSVPTKGLLNIVAAPQLGQSSTSIALPGWMPEASTEAWKAAMAQPLSEPRSQGRSVVDISAGGSHTGDVAEDSGAAGGDGRGSREATPKLVSGEGGGERSGGLLGRAWGRVRDGQREGGRRQGGAGVAGDVVVSETPVPWVPWDGKGVAPRIELKWKEAAKRGSFDLGNGVDARDSAAFQALKHINITDLASAVRDNATLWDPDAQKITNAMLAGREGNAARFKPGCSTAQLIFSDQNAQECFFMPWWNDWKPYVGPVIAEVLSWYGIPISDFESHLMRVQFARMGPGGHILKHVDMGGWAVKLHRVHVPIITNPDVRFLMQDAHSEFAPVHIAAGDVFEINNGIMHMVQNSKTEERVHLLLDISEQRVTCKTLKRGQRCDYQNARGVVC